MELLLSCFIYMFSVPLSFPIILFLSLWLSPEGYESYHKPKEWALLDENSMVWLCNSKLAGQRLYLPSHPLCSYWVRMSCHSSVSEIQKIRKHIFLLPAVEHGSTQLCVEVRRNDKGRRKISTRICIKVMCRRNRCEDTWKPSWQLAFRIQME